MKIQEVWKEKLTAMGIPFETRTHKGKYPFGAAIIFSDGHEISMRGRKIGDELHLISSDDLSDYSNDELKHFTFLIHYFTDLAKQRELRTVLIRSHPFSLLPDKAREYLEKEHHLRYISLEDAAILHKSQFLMEKHNVWFVKTAESPISLLLKASKSTIACFQEKSKEDATFSLFNFLDDRIFNRFGFHYLGYNGNFLFHIPNHTEQMIQLEEEKLGILVTCSVDEIHQGVQLFFNEMKKKLKVKSLFSTSTHYLDIYLGSASVLYNIRNEIKKFLLTKYAPHILEEICAPLVKNTERKELHNYPYSFISVADFYFVADSENLLLHTKNVEEAYDFYVQSIVSMHEEEIERRQERLKNTKDELEKNKASVLKNL